MTVLFILFVAVLLFLFSVTVVLLLVGPTILLQPRRRTADFYRNLGLPTSPSGLGLEFEELDLEGENGIRLSSWLIKAPSPRGTILYLHGVADCKIDGIRLAGLLHARQYNVLLFDSRRHGMSGGEFCTYGFYEKHDVPKIIDYLSRRSDLRLGPVGLFGTSMGAAIAIQAAALDGRIRAVVAENSFATLRSIFDDYQKRMIKLPFHYLRNFVIKRSELIARFKAADVSPLELVARIDTPILFSYSADDQLINPRYTHMLYDRKRDPRELHAITGALHNDALQKGGDAYTERILTFFDAHLR
jgi:uncharacterized protein